VDWALGHAAVHARFAEADLGSILDHHARAPQGPTHQADEHRSLTQGTAGWAALGASTPQSQSPSDSELEARTEGQTGNGVAS